MHVAGRLHRSQHGLAAAPQYALNHGIQHAFLLFGVLVQRKQQRFGMGKAEDARVLFAFYFKPMNPGHGVDTLRVRLLDGDGVNGSELASVEFAVAAGFEGFRDVDLSSVSLVIGNMYTAMLDVPGTSPYWGASFSQDNPYADGRFYAGGQADDQYDMAFRVTPLAADVPEPASLALMSLGLLGFGIGARKKKS